MGITWIAATVGLAAAASVFAADPTPIGSPGEWITSDDYPHAALAHRLEGVTAMRLMVDPQGRVIGCATELSSGSDLLDQTACALVKMRGRYQPARDGSGKAVSASTQIRTKWAVPNDDDEDAELPIPVGPFALTIEADVEKDGRLTHCSAPQAQGLPVTGELLCAMLLKEVPIVKGVAAEKMLGRHATLRVSLDLAEAQGRTP